MANPNPNRRNPIFEFQKIFQYEANELISAYQKGQVLHKSRDIDTAGAQVELAARSIIRRRLPASYYVSQGHIVNSDFDTSGQFDIVIADNSVSPILFKAEDGTEYFPHESIYALGEIKSSFRGGKDWEEFIEKLEFVRILRGKNKTPNTAITPTLDLGPILTLSNVWPYRNPLFTFMLFVNSANDTLTSIADKLRDIYTKTRPENLPNVVCILDKGIIINAQVLFGQEGTWNFGPLNHLVEFADSNTFNGWMIIPFGQDGYKEGANLSVLFFSLLEVLKFSVLQLPNFLTYIQRIARPDPTTKVDVQLLQFGPLPTNTVNLEEANTEEPETQS